MKESQQFYMRKHYCVTKTKKGHSCHFPKSQGFARDLNKSTFLTRWEDNLISSNFCSWLRSIRSLEVNRFSDRKLSYKKDTNVIFPKAECAYMGPSSRNEAFKPLYYTKRAV